MNRHTVSKITFWSGIFSLFLIAAISSVLYGGVHDFVKYQRSADPQLQFNLKTLHLFIREDIQRKAQALLTPDLPQNTEIPSIYLFAAEEDLASLNSDLPSSGKTQTIAGHIKDSEDTLKSEAQLRYRGGLPIHWMHTKKSFRVNLPPFTTYRGARKFNIVNPTTAAIFTDVISNELSREIGLITPEVSLVRLFLNNEYNGLHFYLDQVDESLLRKSRRMPGSIYSGDTLYTPNPFGPDKDGVNENAYLNAENKPKLWEDQRLWEKDAARNAESKDNRKDIDFFINTVQTNDPVDFYQKFNLYFDKDKFNKFWALDSLVGTFHHDNFHNHKLYFDPYKGKFEPIQWDIRFWSATFPEKDIAITPLLFKIKSNPILEFEKDKTTYALLQKFPPAEIHQKVDDLYVTIRPEVASDPYRQELGPKYGGFKNNKEQPYPLQRFDEAIDELKSAYTLRNRLLNVILEATHSRFSFKQLAQNKLELTISVDGNSPIDLNIASLERSFGENVRVFRKHNDNLEFIDPASNIRLYPGRKVQHGNASGVVDNWYRMAFGDKMLKPSPLNYTFEVWDGDFELGNSQPITATNSVTGSEVLLNVQSNPADDSETISIHPWDLTSPKAEHIVLNGDLTIEEDQVFEAHQSVTISAGTKFRLSPNSSIVFYGKVTALGTQEQPIEFEPLIPHSPWGAVVVQGASASGSLFENIIVRGGSKTSQRMINYPGQFNLHDLDEFSVSHCTIEDNSIGDDALHVAYSKGSIRDCSFANTAFDAIDIDISTVDVENSQFSNIGNDALDLMTSEITADALIVAGAGDKCISVGESSLVKVINSKLQKCEFGIAIKDQSQATVSRTEFSENRASGVALYRKNPRYSEGGTLIGKNLVGLPASEVSMDEFSHVKIDFPHLSLNEGAGK